MHTDSFSRKVVYLNKANFTYLIDITGVYHWVVARSTLSLGLLIIEQLWTLRLKKLSKRIVVFVRDTVLVHEVVVVQLGRRGDGEASAIGHSKSLRHFIITSEINLPI